MQLRFQRDGRVTWPRFIPALVGLVAGFLGGIWQSWLAKRNKLDETLTSERKSLFVCRPSQRHDTRHAQLRRTRSAAVAVGRGPEALGIEAQGFEVIVDRNSVLPQMRLCK
jgi:hypothetical protein